MVCVRAVPNGGRGTGIRARAEWSRRRPAPEMAAILADAALLTGSPFVALLQATDGGPALVASAPALDPESWDEEGGLPPLAAVTAVATQAIRVAGPSAAPPGGTGGPPGEAGSRASAAAIAVSRPLTGQGHLLAFPVLVGGAAWGAIVLTTPGPASERDYVAGSTAGSLVGLVTENQSLASASEDRGFQLGHARRLLTAATDRLLREVAEELHGRVQTRLLVAWHRIGEGLAVLDADPAEARRLLDGARRLLDEVREEDVRRLGHRLHPSSTRVGLVPSLRMLLDDVGLPFRVEHVFDPTLAEWDDPGDPRIPEELRLAVYRIAEAALSNVARHSRAGWVGIEVGIDDDGQLSLVLSDDGCGFPVATTQPGLGLTTIANRVYEVGGTWRFGPGPGGRGTSVEARLPLACPLHRRSDGTPARG